MRSFLTNRTGSGPVSPISFGMSARMTSLAGSSLSRPQNRTWRGTLRLIQYWENLQKNRSMRRTNSIRRDVDVHSPPETERVSEPETNSEPAPVDGEPQPVRKQGGLLAVLLGRKK